MPFPELAPITREGGQRLKIMCHLGIIGIKHKMEKIQILDKIIDKYRKPSYYSFMRINRGIKAYMSGYCG